MNLNTHLDPELLSAYLDDEVGAAERARVEGHLQACEACRLELESLQWTVNLLRRLPVAPLPRTFYVTEAMIEPERQPSVLERLARQWRPLLGSAAALAALLLLVVLVQPQARQNAQTAADMAQEPAVALRATQVGEGEAADAPAEEAAGESAADTATNVTEAPQEEDRGALPEAPAEAAEEAEEALTEEVLVAPPTTALLEATGAVEAEAAAEEAVVTPTSEQTTMTVDEAESAPEGAAEGNAGIAEEPAAEEEAAEDEPAATEEPVQPAPVPEQTTVPVQSAPALATPQATQVEGMVESAPESTDEEVESPAGAEEEPAPPAPVPQPLFGAHTVAVAVVIILLLLAGVLLLPRGRGRS
ncbi:MAG: anti-sigma factor family protein [Ardenticatenaceae bacterium]